MLTVECRVAEWRRLYDAVGAAEQRLHNAQDGRCTCGRSPHELQCEVLRLQDAAERALHAVDAALAASKVACEPA
ncbi:MAG TPA: hypothetical protein VKD22_05835 [Ramlibacter sp.]|nr:hypothetical protein [Ramlibacter sp.]